MNRAELGEPFATGRSAEIFTWPENDWVLKLFEPDYPSESADLEQQSIDEALRLGVPTIAGHGRVEVDGRPGLLLDRVRGDSLTKQAERNPLKIRSGARALATTHVLVHESPTAEFTEIREATIAALDTAPMAFLDQAQKAKAAALIGGLPLATGCCTSTSTPRTCSSPVTRTRSSTGRRPCVATPRPTWR